MQTDPLTHLYEGMTTRDLVEIAILALAIFGILRFLGRTRGAGVVRGLGLIVVGLFLIAQVVIASFHFHVLGRVLDYLLTTVLLGLLVIFQPELRRGLLVLGRYRLFRLLVPTEPDPFADKLAEAAIAMSRECIGALIAIEREMSLASFVETGEHVDAQVSSVLLQTIFYKHTPLHDGAVILRSGRIAAAACQLPLGHASSDNAHSQAEHHHLGMRHRAGLSLSEETDAVLLIVSEETGRISLAVGGRLEAVSRENLSRRLAELLSPSPGNLARVRAA
jgi:diadenylate cyclase